MEPLFMVVSKQEFLGVLVQSLPVVVLLMSKELEFPVCRWKFTITNLLGLELMNGQQLMEVAIGMFQAF